MIVEDDAEVRETLKLLLDSRGYRTFAASDGPQALAIAAQHGVSLDLIVADYNLPGPNGLEIAGKIEEASARKIPVIMLTGDISAATLLEIANKGHVHLYKPADARTLIHHIAGMLTTNRRETGAPTIFIADDDREIREAMRDMLEMHGYRTEIFAGGSSFWDAYPAGGRGCLLADARMPGIGGLELIERLNKMQASLPVIMITAYGDIAIAVKAMKAGAFDFLQKPANPKELLDCIERALNYSPEHPEHSALQETATAKVDSLTGRQRQILQLVLAGHPSKNIAADLRISQRTVDNHRAAIMRKTEAKSLSALIRIALAAGWLDEPAGAPPPHEQIPKSILSKRHPGIILNDRYCAMAPHARYRFVAVWAGPLAGFGQNGKDGWAGRKRGALPSQIFSGAFVLANKEAVSGLGDRSIKALKANARRKVCWGQYPWR